MTIETYTDETLNERLKEWEKKEKAMISDLQAEREQRHALEQRLSQIETSMAPEDGTPEQKVNRLAQDPDGYISEVVIQAVTPLQQEIVNLRQERNVERAYKWLGKKEKTDPDDIIGSELEKEIVRISKERGMTAMGVVEGTKAAYEIYQQEKIDKERREKEREESISGQSTESVRSSTFKSTGRLTRDMIYKMSPNEYNARREEILKAEKEGTIK